MTVTNTLEIYEIDGEEKHGLDGPLLILKSHWNRDGLVVLQIDGHEYTIDAKRLGKAISNATNWKIY